MPDSNLPRSDLNVTTALSEILPLSVAKNRLAKGMWGSWPTPAAARDTAAANFRSSNNTAKALKALRPGFIPRGAVAADQLWQAALKDKLPVYVAADGDESAMRPERLVRLPIEVLKKLIIPSGTLPDHPIRPTLRAIGDAKLLALLWRGRLVVKELEFSTWYVAERRKGKWPFQTAQKRERRRGRPTKQTERLKDAILTIVQDKRWDRTQPFTLLVALLKENGNVETPSIDTVRRIVWRLYKEYGDVRLYRPIRAKRSFRKKLTAN